MSLLHSHTGIHTTPAHPKCEEIIKLLASDECPSEEEFEAIACLPHKDKSFFQFLNNDNSISTLLEDPMFAMMDLKLQEDENVNVLFINASSSAQVSLFNIAHKHSIVLFPFRQRLAFCTSYSVPK